MRKAKPVMSCGEGLAEIEIQTGWAKPTHLALVFAEDVKKIPQVNREFLSFVHCSHLILEGGHGVVEKISI